MALQVTKTIKPYEILIRFDHETGAFKGACFYGMEISTMDGVFVSQKETKAVPLDLAAKGPFGRTIKQILGEFDTMLTERVQVLQADKERLETDALAMRDEGDGLSKKIDAVTQRYNEHIANMTTQHDELKAEWANERAALVQAVVDERKARIAAAEELANYRQADRVGAILKSRETVSAK